MTIAHATLSRLQKAGVFADEWYSIDENYYYEQYQGEEWKLHPVPCLHVWQALHWHEARPSVMEQSVVLNSAIEKLYEELTILMHKRNPVSADPELEEHIASLFQCIETLQKQEGDLIRGMIKSHLAGPIARGRSILRHAEKLMEDYEHSSSPNTSS